MLADIDIARLIERLQAHALADAPGTLTDTEVAAHIALLNKAMPELAELEVSVRKELSVRSSLETP